MADKNTLNSNVSDVLMVCWQCFHTRRTLSCLSFLFEHLTMHACYAARSWPLVISRLCEEKPYNSWSFINNSFGMFFVAKRWIGYSFRRIPIFRPKKIIFTTNYQISSIKCSPCGIHISRGKPQIGLSSKFPIKTNTILFYVLNLCLNSMSKQFYKYFPIHSRTLLKHLNVILGIQIAMQDTYTSVHQHILAV